MSCTRAGKRGGGIFWGGAIFLLTPAGGASFIQCATGGPWRFGSAASHAASVPFGIPFMDDSFAAISDSPVSSDLAEFVRLLVGHQALLRGYIRTLIPNCDDIRDVLQNTNLVLWERRMDYVPGSSFKAWAFAVARLRALEHRRSLRRDHKLVFDDHLLDLLAGTAEHSQDLERLERKRRALRQCLGRLKPKDRALIACRYSGDCTLEDYARADGRSAGSLRVILNRLRTVLRTCIERHLATGEGAR